MKKRVNGVGVLLIILGILIILELFVPIISLLLRTFSSNIIIGLLLIIIGFYILKGYENNIEERKDKMEKKR